MIRFHRYHVPMSIWKQCRNCGYKTSKDYTICPECGEIDEWDDLNDAGDDAKSAASTGSAKLRTYTVKELQERSEHVQRRKTGIGEFDRLLMGGMVPGQVILIGAAPGFGKSTLCLEIAGRLAADMPVLYASGEESESQIGQRAVRVHADGERLRIVSAKNVDSILASADGMDAGLLIIDSLQAMEQNGVQGMQGGAAQSREAAYAYTDWAKRTGGMAILVSQFTKNDDVAGSNMIAHIVDTILVGESDPESRLKYLRSRKNRYGRTDEVAVFTHEDDGLVSVSDPSGYLIGENDPMSGSALSIMRDGIRMLPVEIDALVAPPSYANPQRQFSGMDQGKARILIAALSKYGGSDVVTASDVFASTINGIRISDPMTDLAILAAVLSSAENITPSRKTAWIGEAALTGRIRGRGMMADRIREAGRLGFDRAVIPAGSMDSVPADAGIQIEGIDSISDILSKLP